jgi:hypothetical protein
MGGTLGVLRRRFGAYGEALRVWARNPFAPANRGATLAALVLMVGFALRVWSAGQARFSGEESWFWSIGRDVATGRSIPALGHPISGSNARHPGAAFFWLIGATQLAGPSPLAAFLAFSLGGWLALGLLALVVARAFGRATGIAFLLLASVSPWWIVYTNSAWPGYLFPTLCALVLVCLVDVVVRPGPAARVALALLLVVGFQIHLSLLHYWLITLVVIAVWRPRLGWAFVVGAAIGVLCYIPYLVDEIRHHFANTIAIAHRSQGGERSGAVLAGLLLDFAAFTTVDVSYLWNEGFWHPFGLARFWAGAGVAETARFYGRAGLAPVAWAALAASWALTAGAWIWFFATLPRRLRAGDGGDRVLAVACLVAVAAIPILYLLSGKGGYPHYVSAVLPLAFLPPALLLGKLLAHRGWRWAAIAYLALFAVGGIVGLGGYYAVDSRWSAPQSTAATRFILDRTQDAGGRRRPFRLEFAFSPSFPNAYALIAQKVFGAPFLSVGVAPDVFRVEPRPPGAAPIGDPDTLVLPSIVVRHTPRAHPAP